MFQETRTIGFLLVLLLLTFIVFFQTIALFGMLREHFYLSLINLGFNCIMAIWVLANHLLVSLAFKIDFFLLILVHTILLAWFLWDLYQIKLHKQNQANATKMSDVQQSVEMAWWQMGRTADDVFLKSEHSWGFFNNKNPNLTFYHLFSIKNFKFDFLYNFIKLIYQINFKKSNLDFNRFSVSSFC